MRPRFLPRMRVPKSVGRLSCSLISFSNLSIKYFSNYKRQSIFLLAGLLILCSCAGGNNQVISSPKEVAPPPDYSTPMTLDEKSKKMQTLAIAVQECKSDPDCLIRVSREIEKLNKIETSGQPFQQSQDKPKPLSLGAVPPGRPLCGKKVRADDVRRILSAWLIKIEPKLPPDLRRKIENEMAGYPKSGPPDVSPISFTVSANQEMREFKPEIKRRDWGYAWQGLAYTLAGIMADNDENMINLGVWCFIKGALLQLEAAHLGNVGFILILMGELDDASTVLCYAAAMDSLNPSVNNNLAFVLTEQGRNKEALMASLRAAALRPDSRRYRKNMSEYARAAGLNPNDLSLNPAGPNSAGIVQSRARNTKSYQQAVAIVGSEKQNFQRLFMKNNKYYSSKFYAQYPSSPVADYERKQMQLGRDYQKCVDDCQDSFRCDAGCRCDPPYLQKMYRASIDIYDALVFVLEEWQLKNLNDLETHYQRSLAALNGIQGLSPYEYSEMVRLLYMGDDFVIKTIESNAKLLEPHEATIPMLKGQYRQSMAECARTIREAETTDPSDYYGRRPIVLKRLDSDSGRIWNIYLGVGSLTLEPGGTIKVDVSVAPWASAKLMYNVKTNDFGLGVGIGLSEKRLPGSLTKLMFKTAVKTEMVLMYDTVKGVSLGLDAGLSPKIGVLPGKPTAGLELLR